MKLHNFWAQSGHNVSPLFYFNSEVLQTADRRHHEGAIARRDIIAHVGTARRSQASCLSHALIFALPSATPTHYRHHYASGAGSTAVQSEGDVEVFQFKKSTRSRELVLAKNAAAVSLNLESTVMSRSSGPSYDDAYLKELKASTPNGRLSSSLQAENEISVDINEPSLQVMETGTGLRTRGVIYQGSQGTLRSSQKGKDIGGRRLSSGDPRSRRGDEADGPHPESRLMREEDELGEAEEEPASVDFLKFPTQTPQESSATAF
ncbi:hypothetical protein JOM56_000613 [Amanita muscaria]